MNRKLCLNQRLVLREGCRSKNKNALFGYTMKPLTTLTIMIHFVYSLWSGSDSKSPGVLFRRNLIVVLTYPYVNVRHVAADVFVRRRRIKPATVFGSPVPDNLNLLGHTLLIASLLPITAPVCYLWQENAGMPRGVVGVGYYISFFACH